MVLPLICSACDLFPGLEGDKSYTSSLTDGFCLVFGDSIVINHTEIEGYDTSTHMVYLKAPHPLFEDRFDLETASLTFSVYAFRKKAYTGTIWPAWSSSFPPDIFIQWPSFYPAYLIHIASSRQWFFEPPDTIPDPRKSAPVMQALKKYGQLHSGLSLIIENIQVENHVNLIFSFTLTNADTYDFYILSPEKMGSGLFHYYTNGLTLFSQAAGYLTHRDEVKRPDPWDSWSYDWLDLLESGNSVTYTIDYTLFDSVPAGPYYAFFRYPGLSHIEQEGLEIPGGRIWMGEIAWSNSLVIK